MSIGSVSFYSTCSYHQFLSNLWLVVQLIRVNVIEKAYRLVDRLGLCPGIFWRHGPAAPCIIFPNMHRTPNRKYQFQFCLYLLVSVCCNAKHFGKTWESEYLDWNYSYLKMLTQINNAVFIINFWNIWG